jgi:hypothetical protein
MFELLVQLEPVLFGNHSIAFQSIPEAMAVIQTDSVAGLERLISGS